MADTSNITFDTTGLRPMEHFETALDTGSGIAYWLDGNGTLWNKWFLDKLFEDNDMLPLDIAEFLRNTPQTALWA